MAMTSREFLKKFFNIHRLNDMKNNDYERWVQFEEFVTKNNMTDNMKKWAGYLVKDPQDPKKYMRLNGFYEIQDYPNFDDLDETELEELFLACQVAFDGLKKNRDAYIGNAKVYNFINNFYDVFAEKVSSRVALETTEKSIEKFAALLEELAKADLATLREILNPVLKGRSIDAFLGDVKSKKHNKNDEFQSTLIGVANVFTGIKYKDARTKDAIEKLLSKVSEEKSVSIQTNAATISDEYGSWVESRVSNESKQKFKDNYVALFKELYKEQKVFDAFKQYEGGDKRVSEAIEKTKSDMDYANSESKDFVPKKREEELTVPQRIEKWASNTWEDYFAKYSKFKGDRVYLNEASGEICKAFDKIKFKPTDGLKKILDSEKDIKAKLQTNIKARDGFDWLVKSLKELQSDPKTAKAFEGALESGHLMKSLVKEISIMAAEADDPKVTEKARIALEVLSVIKYGNTTSKIMDAIKGDKDLFKLLSNKDLSWNKNAGVQFITAAMDNTIRAAFLGVSYGATFLWNTARKSGSKFNQKYMYGKKDKTGERMKKASERWQAEHDIAKQELIDTTNSAKKAKTAQEAKRDATGIKDSEDLNAKKDELTDWMNERNTMEAEIAPTREKLRVYNDMLDMLDHFDYLEKQKSTLGGADPQIAEELSKNQANILDQMYQQYEYELEELEGLGGTDPTSLKSLLIEQVNKLDNAEYRKKVAEFETKNGDIYSRQEAIDKFKKATAEIEALDETITKDQKKIDEWDDNHHNVYEELMAYWDFLETGRDSHTGPLYTRRPGSAKKHQERLNPKAVELYEKFRKGYHAV
ncbi:MAG: hypothetical protein J6S80_04785 [Alphaproteobacteria bacterium]|nr:hypothetical protein [Alphaproteobacteria bacterium]